jgi:hypothetical protein
MKDLLKEAIADAKAVRETALANAKLALEEAFAPRIQSMISSHLQQEAEDDMMDEEDDEVDMTAMGDSEAPADATADDMSAEAPAEEEMPAEPTEDEMTEEGEEEGDLDLEEIIRELEADEESTEEPMAETDDMDSDDSANDEEMTSEGEEDMEDEMDEEIDIQEVIRALREEDEAPAEDSKEEEMKEELEEAYNVIKFLKSKINEVNLLNAKLLYSNKLFRTYSLNEGQKLKVIENFDRAHNLREVKLLYTALAENFTGTKNNTKKVVKESFASKPVASTKPAAKTVLNEGDVLANRFKKLAGLIK